MTIMLPVFAEYIKFMDTVVRAEKLFLEGNVHPLELSGIEKVLSSYPDAELMARGTSNYGARLAAVREQLKKASESLKSALPDYIYIPSINLYIAKQRTLQGKRWTDAHVELQSQNLRMPTIPEFIAFVKYLKQGYPNRAEADSILDDILTVRSQYRGGWLDADFKVINKILRINYNHKAVNGILKPMNSEPLEACLMKDCKVDLASFNRQGLPTKAGNDFSYWFPRPDNNSVAR